MIQHKVGAGLELKTAPKVVLKEEKDQLKKMLASDIPEAMRDFSDLDLCQAPLAIARHGQVYNKSSLETWFSYKLEANIHKKHTAKDGANTVEVAFDCPNTGAPLRIDQLVTDGKEYDLLVAEFSAANNQKAILIDLIDKMTDQKEIGLISDKIKLFHFFS